MGGLCGKEKKKIKRNKNIINNRTNLQDNRVMNINGNNNQINNNNNNNLSNRNRSNIIPNQNIFIRSNNDDFREIRRNMFRENNNYIGRDPEIDDFNHLNLNIRNSHLNNLQPDMKRNMNHMNLNDHNGNNLNISINDELSMSCLNNVNNINPNENFNFLRNDSRLYANPNNNNQYKCNLCSASFRSNDELEIHHISCRRRDSNGVHTSLNEIFRLFQSLNRQFRMNERMILSDLLSGEEPEEQTEYIDWIFDVNKDGHVTWKNNGKIILSKDILNEISERSIYEVINERYYMKRIWFIRYINKNIYDKNGNNTTLVVSRDNLLEESFNQFMTTDGLDLKRAMHIFFVDEVAHDIGGVYREWYTSLFEIIFSAEQNFFYQIEDDCPGKNSYFIPTTLPKIYSRNYLEYYEFIGKVLSKAILDKITLKTNFNIVLIKLILNIKIELEDLRYLDSSYYQSLKSILDNPIENALDFTFTWNIRDKYNNFEEVELIPDGKNILLSDENKTNFVEKVVELLSYKSIKDKVDAFLRGFQSLIPQRLVKIFSPYEFDFLLSGQSVIDLKDWISNTTYKGYYNEKHPTIKMFWQVLSELPPDKLIIFYRFCTGGTRVPIDGFNSLPGTRNKYQKFCIENSIVNESKYKNRLIEAKTCFNRIYLPDYETKELMVKAVNTIIENDTNFFGKE